MERLAYVRPKAPNTNPRDCSSLAAKGNGNRRHHVDRGCKEYFYFLIKQKGIM